ncbi:phosphoglycerate mutase (2,3-diphosphoglycerate-independent), partial [bacterium]|nr:phosphoglycerate mutase (2,3-diphosphoglycerate-independent) [bacterium]
MKKRIKPTVLVILDGVGINKKKEHNAVQLAKTPHIDYLMQKYPHCSLQASGKAVGLLQGDIGNSEVGHLTLGAGRVIQQPVSIIHEAIKNNFFFENSPLKNCLKNIKQSNGNLHIMGLLSDASVHSHIDHLQAFLKAAQQANIKQVFIHPFLDGRDTPPQSAKIYLDKLEKIIKKVGIGTIASIHGRFYAMDRNNNWQRTQKSYDVLTKKQNSFNASWKKILQEQYKNKITDEFIPPTQLNPNGIIQENDSIIFFNFRPDRARQLTTAFIKKTFTTFPIKKIHLNCFITPTKYADNLKTTILFKKEPIKNCLPEIFHLNKKRFFA